MFRLRAVRDTDNIDALAPCLACRFQPSANSLTLPYMREKTQLVTHRERRL
jgi:hypothetical protein